MLSEWAGAAGIQSGACLVLEWVDVSILNDTVASASRLDETCFYKTAIDPAEYATC